MDQRRTNDPDLSIDPTDPSLIPGEPLVDPPDLAMTGAAMPEASMPASGSTEVRDGTGKATQAKDAATSAASDAASTASDEAKRVASEAKTQARSVVEEVKGQATGLLEQTRDQLRDQADSRSANAVGALRTFSERLQALADGRPGEAGPLSGYLDEARGQVSGFASRLETDGVEGLVSDVSDFARRRPGMFLMAAAGTGFLVGRLVRGAKAANADGSGAARGTRPMGELAPMDPIAAAPTMLADPSDPVMPSTTGVVVP